VTSTASPGGAAAQSVTWHEEVRRFKRELLERVLVETGGNRTHAARQLGVQRTYLMRLIRDLDVLVAARPGRRDEDRHD